MLLHAKSFRYFLRSKRTFSIFSGQLTHMPGQHSSSNLACNEAKFRPYSTQQNLIRIKTETSCAFREVIECKILNTNLH